MVERTNITNEPIVTEHFCEWIDDVGVHLSEETLQHMIDSLMRQKKSWYGLDVHEFEKKFTQWKLELWLSFKNKKRA